MRARPANRVRKKDGFVDRQRCDGMYVHVTMRGDNAKRSSTPMFDVVGDADSRDAFAVGHQRRCLTGHLGRPHQKLGMRCLERARSRATGRPVNHAYPSR
jgi:hypothetical protein